MFVKFSRYFSVFTSYSLRDFAPVVFCLVVAIASGFSQPAAAQELQAQKKTLVIGAISSNPKKAVAKHQVFADYLVSQMSHLGYTEAIVKVARDVRHMRRWLKQGKVDLLSESMYASSELYNEGLVSLVGLRLKEGHSDYHSIFYTRIDSGIDSLDGLVGKTIVFEDRGSTSAFYEPAATLLNNGFKLEEIDSPRDTVEAGTIGYLFADELTAQGGEMNMWMWVYNNIVPASAFSNLDWDNKIPWHLKEQIQIIHRSDPMPRSIVLMRKNLAKPVAETLRTIMYEAHTREDGVQVLRRFRKTSQILPITPDVEIKIRKSFPRKQWVDEQLDNY